MTDRTHIELQAMAVYMMVFCVIHWPLKEGLSWVYGEQWWFAFLTVPLAVVAGIKVKAWYRSWSLKGLYRSLGDRSEP